MVGRINAPASADGLRQLAEDAIWETHPQRTLAVARSTYLIMPGGYKLWLHSREFSTIDAAIRLARAL
jgi:hypothetical protein